MTADNLTHIETARLHRVSVKAVARFVKLHRNDPMFLDELAQREDEAKDADREFCQVVIDLLESKHHVLSARVVQQELKDRGLPSIELW